MGGVARRRHGRRREKDHHGWGLLAALLITAAVQLADPEPAAAVRLVDERGNVVQPYQRWADRSRVPTVQEEVRVILGDGCPHPSFVACAFARPLEIIMERRGRSREVLYHELGHSFDYVVMGEATVVGGAVADTTGLSRTTGARSEFAQIIGRSHEPWVNDSPRSLPETFATAYAQCALRAKVTRRSAFRNRYRPTPARHRRICRLIRRQPATPTLVPLGEPPVPPPKIPTDTAPPMPPGCDGVKLGQELCVGP
jgi:hypothetical protein